MATRNPQTQAKRARELAVKEKRERKRARKAERAAAAAEEAAAPNVPHDTPDDGRDDLMPNEVATPLDATAHER